MSISINTEFENYLTIPFSAAVTVTKMGHVTEVKFMQNANHSPCIQKLSKTEYVNTSTGEVGQYHASDSRQDNLDSLRKTFARLRGLINANILEPKYCRWITLTYAENMRDPERLYDDFRKFHQRFKRYVKSKGFSYPEYIVVMEPQGRGAWHAHLIYIWSSAAPFIPNDELRSLWGHGFVSVKRLDDKVDNIGAYITAYLGDVEVDLNQDVKSSDRLKIVEVETEDGKKLKKGFVKGGRLHFYPSGMNLYRHSKGIKEPDVSVMTYGEFQKLSSGSMTFKSQVKLVDDERGYENTIVKEYYNDLRSSSDGR